ncbi:hypothetical protein AC578_7999 [Pseudocercospora eumusae]|uniref:Methyltransferase domain-containing protein n=1 Tax=Pseudocercospora eumusae TaxID=321146 RepID=A0A139H0E5_9PEZI|nr:hypothetical protein AC578_7999 [Pseudocercospora eumusae]
MGNICSSTTPRKKAQHISQETLDEEEEKQYHSSPPKSLQLIPTPDTPTTTKASTQCAYMMPTFLSMAQKTPHLKVLDIGCGSGGITLDLAQKIPQGHITGYDICGSALSTARMRAEERGVRNVEFLKGEKEEDVYALPFRDAEFDVVYTHQAVAHFRGERVRARAIQEFLRVTKKNGEGVLCSCEEWWGDGCWEDVGVLDCAGWGSEGEGFGDV